MKKIIIITGCLASGKSHFYQEMKQKTKLVGFSKDELKIDFCGDSKDEEIYDCYGLGSLAFKKMLDELENLMEDGRDIIIEGAFSNTNVKNKENEQEKITNLMKKYGYSSLTFHLSGDIRTLYQRFVNREESNERDQILRFNRVLNDYRLYKLINLKLQKCSFDDCVIKIDTTDFSKVDYSKYYDMTEKFLKEKG